jgi:lipopolysaccharide/colanic/teichoic acid biosynthesis glycosyltransferase
MRLQRTEPAGRSLVPPLRTSGDRYAPVKRIIDVVGAACLIPFCAPVLLIGAAAVWLDAGAPVIHRRRVLGRRGDPFDAYKLRTMVRDADHILAEDEELRSRYAAANKLATDPRVTRSGRWLRRFSLDEVPQLVNVLKGEMSLVGPRMLTANELADWGDEADAVMSVRPGITGLWQVSGRQSVGKSERIRLDGEYVRGMSLGLDLAILARTVPAVLSGRGAC